jgi:transposase-like protein
MELERRKQTQKETINSSKETINPRSKHQVTRNCQLKKEQQIYSIDRQRQHRRSIPTTNTTNTLNQLITREIGSVDKEIHSINRLPKRRGTFD